MLFLAQKEVIQEGTFFVGVVFMRETSGTFFCSPTAYKFLVSSAPKKIHVSTQNGLQHHCRGNWGVGTCLPLGERDGKMLGSSSIEVQGFACFLSPSPIFCDWGDPPLDYSSGAQNHQITEAFALEGAVEGHLDQPPCHEQGIFCQIKLLEVSFNLTLVLHNIR